MCFVTKMWVLGKMCYFKQNVFCEISYVNFVWEILYCMMQFLDTHKSDRDAYPGSCNDDPKVSKNETCT